MIKQLEKLKNMDSDTFTAKEAEALGVSRFRLAHYTKMGLLQRVSRGVYAFPERAGFDLIDYLKATLKAFPQAVFGFDTALQLQDLTDQSSSEIHVIVPTHNVPKRILEDVVIHRVNQRYYLLGAETIHGLPVTSLERTFIDFLRCGEPVATLVKVWQTATSKGISIDTSKLLKIAKTMRAQGRLERLLEAVP